METTRLQPILDSLNQKKYAQWNGQLPNDNATLTEVEQQLIDTYRPGQALISYGTLAPGRPNYALVEPIPGSWLTATIRGKLVNKGWGAESGYYGFVPSLDQEQTAIAAYVLTSSKLADYWPMLDEFEGIEYERILVPYFLDTGKVGVGHLYALRNEAV